MARKKSQFGGLSAAAIKKATEQAKKAQETAKKPTPKPVETTQPINVSTTQPISPTSGFTGVRGTFTPPTSPPVPQVQPPVRPPVVQPPVKPTVTAPQPTPQPKPQPTPQPTPQPVVEPKPTPVPPAATTTPMAEQVQAQTRTFDAAGSTPGTFEYVRELDDGRFLGGFPGDQSVFGSRKEAEEFVIELQEARQAQIAAREAAATDPDPMRTTMSVVTADGTQSFYTAEGGVREVKPDGTETYIPPFKPSEQETEKATDDSINNTNIDNDNTEEETIINNDDDSSWQAPVLPSDWFDINASGVNKSQNWQFLLDQINKGTDNQVLLDWYDDVKDRPFGSKIIDIYNKIQAGTATNAEGAWWNTSFPSQNNTLSNLRNADAKDNTNQDSTVTDVLNTIPSNANLNQLSTNQQNAVGVSYATAIIYQNQTGNNFPFG